MPQFDQTGPMGQGPRTGRGFGPCGMGLGWRRRFVTKKDQKQALSDYKKALEEELKAVDEELAESQE